MILSCWISKSVLIPLQKLSRGTKEIREGNLDTVIEYVNPDEFGQVCHDFDEMRVHLKESVEQRLKDEQRRKDLITGISHDLRTPLTSISGYVDGLLEGMANTPENIHTSLPWERMMRSYKTVHRTGIRFLLIKMK